MTVRLPRLLGSLLVFGFLVASHPASQGALTIGGYQIVKQTRISASEWEFTARATLFNGGAALTGATATVVSLSPAARIVDGSLTFGAIGAGASGVSTDTFSFRQRPTAAVRLQWTVLPAGGYTPPTGVVLQGGGTTPAVAALVRKDPVGALPQDIVDHTILTRLDVAIRPDATVAQVNAMLAAINGGIVTMRPLFPVITVAVPRQADATALEALAATVRGMPGIRLAIPARTLDVSIAPPAPLNDVANFLHLQDARLPAAWNANALADCTQKTSVLMADVFVRPLPAAYAAFTTQVPNVQALGDSTDVTHGYDVTAVMAAALDGVAPTGANPFPECLDIRALNVGNLSTVEWSIAIEAALPATGNVVLNASLQFSDECGEVAPPKPCEAATFRVTRPFERAVAGLVARHLLRPYQDRVLIAAAAGNHAAAPGDIAGQVYQGSSLARVSSPFNIAATSDAQMTWLTDPALWEPQVACIPSFCFPSLTPTAVERDQLDGLLSDLGELNGTPLQHVLIVGSATSSLHHPPSLFSEPGADVFAVGEVIPGIVGANSGTSLAAPQVSGLASYLLMMLPARHGDLGVIHDVHSAIVAARGTANRFVDAYDSLLSLDPSGAPDPATWLVRKALLDLDQNGQFDDLDLSEFTQQLLEPPNFDTIIQNGVADDSRYDLNGDSFTGGESARVPMDLERTGSFRYGGPLLETLTIQVAATQRTIDESAVNDLDVLCYYAYSPLYTGDTTARDFFLAAPCEGDVTYEGTVSTIRQINGPDDSATTTSNWTVRLTLGAGGGFEATGTVVLASNSAATYPGGSGSCSVTTVAGGTGPVIYFGGRLSGTPADLPGELAGIFDLTDTTADTCIGTRTIVFPDNVLSLPFSFFFDKGPSDIMHGEYTNGQLTAIVWDYHESTGGGPGTSMSLTIVGRLEPVP